MRETLKQLQKLFLVRQCQDSYFANRKRPCLQYQIQRCTGPCVGLVSKEDYARDVEHALLFLSGDGMAVTDSLVDRMEKASERLDFELAAQYRDQLARLKRIESQQVVSRRVGDVDIIGYAREGAVHCITVLFIRGGRMLGSRNHFPRTTQGTDYPEILRAFLLQYYPGREVPKEIIVSEAITDGEVLQSMLTEKSGHGVAIRHAGSRRSASLARHGPHQRKAGCQSQGPKQRHRGRAARGSSAAFGVG